MSTSRMAPFFADILAAVRTCNEDKQGTISRGILMPTRGTGLDDLFCRLPITALFSIGGE